MYIDQSEASTDLVEAESLLEVAVKTASDEIPRAWTEAEVVIPETSANGMVRIVTNNQSEASIMTIDQSEADIRTID